MKHDAVDKPNCAREPNERSQDSPGLALARIVLAFEGTDKSAAPQRAAVRRYKSPKLSVSMTAHFFICEQWIH